MSETNSKQSDGDTPVEIDRALEHKGMDVWFSKPIGKIRTTADPGGVALTLPEARAFHDQLGDVIDHAETVLADADVNANANVD